MNHPGPSFLDLPTDVMVNVLLRLSLKRVFVCKIVCKTWHDLISEPEFAKLQFDQARVYPLIQLSGYSKRSRMLYLLQPEEEDFEHKLEMCECDHIDYKRNCDCFVSFDLGTKFKLPSRNPQMLFDSVGNNCIKLRFADLKYRIVNSCKGMLCLSNPDDNDPLIVCNPVSNEFINLPESKAKKVSWSRNMLCGFGFSPASNQYKVIKMLPQSSLDAKYNDGSIGAKVHTIGTETWRDIEFSTPAIRRLSPTYLNGFLYWLSDPCGVFPLCIVSFDIENECFGSVSAPPTEDSIRYDEVCIGVLGGELSISCCLLCEAIEVWLMKDCGTKKVWSKVCSFRADYRNYLPYGPWEPIKYLNDGALLMFNSNESLLIHIHPRKRRVRYFRFPELHERLEVIAHIPSFVPLKDALSGHDVKVLKPRCTELKLRYEDRGISLWEMKVIA